ncbi:MAG: pyridoxal-phosphate dependent enzyme [Anaerolineae bacterium]
MITGPTFEEMLHPHKIDSAIRAKANNARKAAPLDPINLFNITWRDIDNNICHIVLPKELTGVDCDIVVLYGREFPSGSHKVGAAYSVLLEKELFGEVDPAVHTLVWPSTGNYGIGGAWVGGRMGCKSVVVLPEGMSRERFQRIESYGASVIKTVGSESNVKEIYDKTHELARDPNTRILNQFEVMGNYRFHYHVTGNTLVELAAELRQRESVMVRSMRGFRRRGAQVLSPLVIVSSRCGRTRRSCVWNRSNVRRCSTTVTVFMIFRESVISMSHGFTTHGTPMP